MARVALRIREEILRAIEAAVGRRPEGMTVLQIAEALNDGVPRRTLQYRLKALVDEKRLTREGSGRGARYRLPRAVPSSVQAAAVSPGSGAGGAVLPPLSEAGAEIRDYVRRPPGARRPVGYDRDFLDSYRPNESRFLSQAEQAELREIGTPRDR